VKITEPFSPEEFRLYFKTRWEILRKPWNEERGSEIDDFENISLHIMALEGDEIAGIGRLTYFSSGEGQVRYMGVSEKFKNQKVGTQILTYLESKAKEMGLKRIILNARENALGFYSKMGYKTDGKPFIGFAGIPHTKMYKKLKT
jgi:N-acetylglutamate synthase-like GNAT family acetyltransferase